MTIQQSIKAESAAEEAIRKAKTIGQLERLAGIETNADRALFWLQFVRLKNRASKAGKEELKRMIRSRYAGQAASRPRSMLVAPSLQAVSAHWGDDRS